MKALELIDFLDQTLHPEYQENYDNSGFLVGNPDQEISGVLISLDITQEVVEEALRNNFNFIVSHHPLIFGGMKRITPENETGRLVMQIVKNDICVYAAHTNLDNLDWGVNGMLADRLGLTGRRILRPMRNDRPDLGAGMVGKLPHPTPADQFHQIIKERLKLPFLRVSTPVNKLISIVAICGGSGSFLIDDAKAAHADIFLTGDLKYHDFQHVERDLQLVDIGHFESEQFAKDLFYRVISEKFCNFAVQIANQNKGYIYYI